MHFLGFDITELANATILLLTALIGYAAVYVGRRAKPEQEPAATVKMDGMTIISSEPLSALSRSIECLTLESVALRRDAEKIRQVGYRNLELGGRLKEELEELRVEIRRVGDALIARR